jgi:prepilin-type processing-associated H-X9-DG protein
VSLTDLTVNHEDRGQITIFHFREGIERFFMSDINNAAASNVAQSERAVMWDPITATPVTGASSNYITSNHVPGGCNMLHMDGHSEFLKYPSKFPVSATWATITKTVMDTA